METQMETLSITPKPFDTDGSTFNSGAHEDKSFCYKDGSRNFSQEMAEVPTASSLDEMLEKLHAEFDEVLSRPISDLELDWRPPYEFPPGRSDCFLLAFKEARVECIEPCAKKVLEIFNREHDTDYELVDCLDVCVAREYELFLHCNFTAKPKSAPLHAGDFSTKVFFAEIEKDSKYEKVPTTYCMLDGVNAKLGCDMCPEVIAHPTSGPDEGLILLNISPYFARV